MLHHTQQFHYSVLLLLNLWEHQWFVRRVGREDYWCVFPVDLLLVGAVEPRGDPCPPAHWWSALCIRVIDEGEGVWALCLSVHGGGIIVYFDLKQKYFISGHFWQKGRIRGTRSSQYILKIIIWKKHLNIKISPEEKKKTYKVVFSNIYSLKL